ncbi:MAG: hypothetical protein JSV33_12495, partial [bacterium]
MRAYSDRDLLGRIERLRGRERAVLVEILCCLAEIDRRRLYLPRGYGSLFEFCTGYLHYSRSGAGRRIRAARCLAGFPQVADMLLSGEINLCVLSLVSGILTNENADEILSWIKGRSFREVELLVSRHRPERMLRDRVKPVCIMTECADSMKGAGTSTGRDRIPSGRSTPGVGTNSKATLTFTPNVGSEKIPSDPKHGPEGPEGMERVMITQKFKLEFAVDPAFMEKLERVISLLSTKHPGGLGFEKLFEILMDDYLERHNPEKRMIKRKDSTRRCSRKISHKKSRHIPASVRDEVFARDGGRCTFVGPEGKRCGSRWNIQVDHIVPYGK